MLSAKKFKKNFFHSKKKKKDSGKAIIHNLIFEG